ncbi:MAG: OmpA family protein [Gammaproteobacteria bacterium]|nr:OmpA family protein [Gammaproteobacteria bacterium]
MRQAKKLKASRYAPVSLTRAQDLLMNAEAELISNRYDTDRPRSLALEAKHNAKHAIYVAKLARAVKKRKTSVEEVLLEWESSIRQLGHAIDKPLYFDDGEYAAIWTVMEAIKDLHAENEHLNLALNDGSAQLAALNAEVQAMQTQLGGEYDTIEELHDLIAKQERMRERFAKVESLFTDDQANVLRKGDNVIIRMIGLNFDSGAAELKSNHVLLLTTLEQAIGGFPESHVVVEGHTDAFGSDALNITLSQERADAVVDHLLANMPISPANLTAFGYGESRPVANNETEEGRTRNRRIDIVIQPNW